MVAYSTKLRLQKPTVGADADVWGGYLNTTVDSIDTLLNAITTTGSANAYILSSGQTLAAYATGLSFLIKPSFTNTGAATINVDALGAKNIFKNIAGTPTAIGANDIYSGVPIRVTYDGTQFILTDLLDAALMAISQLAWSSGSPLLQWTAADTISLTLTPSVTSVAVGSGTVGTNAVQVGAVGQGLYSTGANVAVAANGILRWWVDGTASRNIVPAYMPDGTAAAPALAFSNSTTTGLYRIGAGNIGASSATALVWDWNATRMLMASGFDLQRATDVTTPVAASVGYIGTILVAKDTNYTIAANISGQTLYHTSASTHTYTIDSNANLALPVGFMFSIENESGGGNITLAITTDTLRWGSSTGSRTIAANGSAVLKKVSTTVWRLVGTGIT